MANPTGESQGSSDASSRFLTSNLYHRTSPKPKIPETIKKIATM
jgi:hypothetical protein